MRLFDRLRDLFFPHPERDPAKAQVTERQLEIAERLSYLTGLPRDEVLRRAERKARR